MCKGHCPCGSSYLIAQFLSYGYFYCHTDVVYINVLCSYCSLRLFQLSVPSSRNVNAPPKRVLTHHHLSPHPQSTVNLTSFSLLPSLTHDKQQQSMLSLSTPQHTHAFSLIHPSTPLSTLNPNVCHRYHRSFACSKMGHSDNDAPYFSTSACNASISTTTPLPAALARRRESKYVSLDRDLGKGRDGEKRRGQFLEKVKRRGEEKRFESREEHVSCTI